MIALLPLVLLAMTAVAAAPLPLSAPTELERLRLAMLSAGESCPRTPAGPRFPAVATTLGQGPVYPVLGFQYPPPHQKGLVTLHGDTRLAGRYWHKTLWAVAARYRGPVLVRARRIDRRGSVRFASELGVKPSLRLPDQRFLPRQRRYFPTNILLRGPGCYALQIDGLSFRRVVVFRAVKRLPR